MKFKTKPLVIEAIQWFKNGDHPEDGVPVSESGERKLQEGKVVRYYRGTGMEGMYLCKYCGRLLRDHGWIDIRDGGHIVCPGDWIIPGVKGGYSPCKPDIFKLTYDAVTE